jgi:hypothetical protein
MSVFSSASCLTVVLAGLALAAPAMAQAAGSPQPMPVDCSALTGTPYVCVLNSRPVSVTGIACSGFWGTSPVSIPGGMIPPHGLTAISFPSKCTKTMNITTRDGRSFAIEGFDVTKNTFLNISDN